MLKVSPIGSSAEEVRYYATLGRDAHEYYSDKVRPGMWFGAGAELAGLEVGDDVEEKVFSNLLKGKDKTGDRVLVRGPQDPDKQRRCGFDLTFQVPKSVSAAWSQASPELREDIVEGCERALEETLSVFTEFCAVTRRGKDGLIQEDAAGLIGAIFRHDSSRPVGVEAEGNVPDPHLHWHAVILNMAFRQDGTVGAWDSRPLFRRHMSVALGTLFRVAVAQEMRELGFESFRPDKKRGEEKVSWFELKCVPKSLRDELSKRAKEVEEWMKRKGVSGWKARAKAALATRHKKREFSEAELDKAWRDSGERHHFTERELMEAISKLPEVDRKEVAGWCLDRAVQKIAKTKSRFSILEMLKVTAEESQGLGIGISEVREVLDNALAHSPELVQLKDDPETTERQWTTRERLETEKRMIASGRRLSAKHSHTVSYGAVAKAIRNFPTLRAEQDEAIRYLSTGGDLVNLHGVAGAGKNFLLNVCKQIWEGENYRVIGTALSAKAARQLGEIGIESQHLHKLFYSLKKGDLKLDSNCLVILDESSMVGSVMMGKMLREVIEPSGAKLVLSGDATQLSAIDAGAPARMLAEHTTVCEVNAIIRQREADDRELVHDMRAGRAGKVLSSLIEKDRLFIGDDKEESFTKLISDWKHRAIEEGELRGSLIIAGTNEDVETLNRMAQQERLLVGELCRNSITVGEYQMHVSDRVIATKNRRGLFLENGMEGVVTDIKDEGTLRVKFDNGYQIEIDPERYEHLSLSYASTVHRSQGQTSEHCFFAVDGVMSDREAAYVGLSRPRGGARVYCDLLSGGEDMESLARILERSRAKDNALDHLLADEYEQEMEMM